MPKPNKKHRKIHSYHFSYKNREYFTENLALLLKAAVPIGDALESLKTSSHGRTMRKTLERIQADIEAGYSLASALDRSGIMSDQTLALARLGESSGRLVENLQLAAQQEDKRHTFRSKVRSALIYPSFVMTLTFVVGIGVAWFLLPKLAGTFSQLHVKLPLISRVLINFGLFLKLHGLIAVPAFLAGVMLVVYVLFAAPGTKVLGRKLLFRLPGIGRLMREVEIAQFGYLLGTLLNAGLSATQALKLLAEVSLLPQFEHFYKFLARSIDEGYSFKKSLDRYRKSKKLIPPAIQQMVVAGERSGALPDVLLTIGRTYEQKSDITTANLEAIIEPILLIIVWLGVLLVAIAVIIPIYSLVGGLNK